MSEPAIAVAHLNHHFGAGELRRQILFDVSTDVREGEILILTGPSGSGKTTLLTLIGALRSAQEGSLRLLGRELRGATEADLVQVRKRIGYVFQAHNLLDALSAQQNVQLSLELFDEIEPGERRRRAAEALEAVGLGQRLDARPSELSGGQRQRVAIARALARRPRVLLADEPTASLDRETGRAVVELIEKLARKDGVTVVLVTHDSRILDVADRIIALEDGRLTSLMAAVTLDTERMMRMLADDIRKGDLVRRVSGMDEKAFEALLAAVTTETQRLLGLVETVQSEAFESMLGEVIEAYAMKVGEILEADRVRLLFRDDETDELWSLARCPHGRPTQIRRGATAVIADARPTISRQQPAAGGSLDEAARADADRARAGLSLAVTVEDSGGRPFAVIEAERRDAGPAFTADEEERLARLAGSLGTMLESWWRMSCTCRSGRVGRVSACCGQGASTDGAIDRGNFGKTAPEGESE